MHLRESTAVTVMTGVAATAATVSAVAPANAAAKADTAREAAVVRAHVTGPATTRNAGAQRSRTTSAASCYSEYMCFWYLNSYSGSRAGFGVSDSDFADDYFISEGAGQGTSMTNNTDSYHNYNSDSATVVWTSPNYTGYSLVVQPGTGGNFTARYRNNVESFYFS